MRPHTHFTCNATTFKTAHKAHVRNDNNNILRAAELNLAFFLTLPSTHGSSERTNERKNKKWNTKETKIPIHIIRCSKFDLVSVMSAPFAGKSARFCISLWVFFLSVWVCGGLICSQCFTLYAHLDENWSIFSFSCFFSFQSRFTSLSECIRFHAFNCCCCWISDKNSFYAYQTALLAVRFSLC